MFVYFRAALVQFMPTLTRTEKLPKPTPFPEICTGSPTTGKAAIVLMEMQHDVVSLDFGIMSYSTAAVPVERFEHQRS